MMTATYDNSLGAFAVALQASLLRMGALSALGQLGGALAELLSVWLSPCFSRLTLHGKLIEPGRAVIPWRQSIRRLSRSLSGLDRFA